MTIEEEKFLKNILKFGSFNIFFGGLKSMDLDQIDSEIKKDFNLRLDIKNSNVAGMQLVKKTDSKWEIIYSNHLDKSKKYSLKEIVTFLKNIKQ